MMDPIESLAEGERLPIGTEPIDDSFDDGIIYLLPIAGDDDHLTAFQGFSAGLCDVSSLLRRLPSLPAVVSELCVDRERKLNLIVEGRLKYRAVPLNVAHLARLDLRMSTPFCVVLSTPRTDAMVAGWVQSCTVKPLHVTTGETGAEVHRAGITLARLRSYIEKVLALLAGEEKYREQAVRLRNSMLPTERRIQLDFPATGHNALLPTELALVRAGFDFREKRRFQPWMGDEPVLEAMRRSCEMLLSTRPPDMGLTPSLTVATVHRSHAMETALIERLGEKGVADAGRSFATGVKVVREQSGYFYKTEHDIRDPNVFAAVSLRADELATYTDALVVRCCSELSGFIRLPPSMDAVVPTVKMLADCYRGNSNRRKEKLGRLVQQLRAKLLAGVPAELSPFLDCEQKSIRIVSNLPLEWFPMRTGEALLFRHTCSRIPCTPGNSMFQETLPKPTLGISANTLTEVLVLRSFSETDRIRRMLETALETLKELDGIDLRIVDVSSIEDVVAALNSFEGAWLVFDGHGARTELASGLRIGGRTIDPFQLRGLARVPPIVFPIACDIHPVDSKHSSAGVALLAAGARSVIGSLLPVDALNSTMFLARLLRAVHKMVPMLFSRGIPVLPWVDLFSIVQKSQLIHESSFMLRRRSPELHEAITNATAGASARVLNRMPNWYEAFLDDFAELTGKNRSGFVSLMNTEMPLPDCSLYVQLGDPESILIVADDFHGVHSDGPPDAKSFQS